MSGQTQADRCFVLDASFFIEFCGVPDFIINSGFKCYVPLSVKEEIKSFRARAIFDSIKPILIIPQKKYVDDIKEICKKTCDKLTSQDVDVLAVALMLRDQGKNVVVLTEDYGIMNIAKLLSLECENLTKEGIKNLYVWRKKCVLCGKLVKKECIECPFCGSKKFKFIPKKIN